jgi:hypothetical protein
MSVTNNSAPSYIQVAQRLAPALGPAACILALRHAPPQPAAPRGPPALDEQLGRAPAERGGGAPAADPGAAPLPGLPAAGRRHVAGAAGAGVRGLGAGHYMFNL